MWPRAHYGHVAPEDIHALVGMLRQTRSFRVSPVSIHGSELIHIDQPSR